MHLSSAFCFFYAHTQCLFIHSGGQSWPVWSIGYQSEFERIKKLYQKIRDIQLQCRTRKKASKEFLKYKNVFCTFFLLFLVRFVSELAHCVKNLLGLCKINIIIKYLRKNILIFILHGKNIPLNNSETEMVWNPNQA